MRSWPHRSGPRNSRPKSRRRMGRPCGSKVLGPVPYLCSEVEPRTPRRAVLGLPRPDERRKAVRHVLDLLAVGRDLRSIGAAEILEVGGVADHFVQHVLHRLRLAARHPERPLELFLGLGGQLVPAVVPLLEEFLLGHLVQERINRTRGRPPPPLRHRLDFVHDLRAVLRRIRKDRDDPCAQAPSAVHHPAKRGKHTCRRSYRITDIYPLPLESVFRYRKSDMPKYRPCVSRRGGGPPWQACKRIVKSFGIEGSSVGGSQRSSS